VYRGDALPAFAEQGTRLEGGTLRIGMASEPPHLNPQLDPVDARGRDIAYYVYESLAQTDPRSFRPEPRLAESWDVSEDRRTFRFQLRRGVKWHDGQPFTAADVVFTFEKLRDAKVAATGMRGYVEPIVSVVAEDPHTVVVTTSQPYWFALEAITDIYIYPKHASAALETKQIRAFPEYSINSAAICRLPAQSSGPT
jgi:peptide/nickel transport system substrate-binding protein